MVTYGILMNSKFSYLHMKHHVCHMSTCTESACIYALFDITDKFFTHLWTNVSNHTLNFSLELKNHAWFVGIHLRFHKSPQEDITRGKITRSWWPFLITMQEYHLL